MKPENAHPRKERLVIGVDQAPFSVLNNEFCLAYPLFVESTGEDLEPEDFGNRGRLWWMTTRVQHDQLIPGTLHVVTIENAVQPAGDDPDKDQFQVDISSHSLRSENWFEVLEVDAPMPSVDDLAHRGIPRGRRPLQHAIVRFTDRVVGPMSCRWTLSDQTVRLVAVEHDSVTPRTRPSTDLDGHPALKDVAWWAGKHDKNSSGGQFEVRHKLMRSDAVASFLADGSEFDYVPLDEVARTYQERLRRSDFKREIYDEPISRLEQLLSLDDESERSRFERFRGAHEAMRERRPESEEFSQALRSRLISFSPRPAEQRSLPTPQAVIEPARAEAGEPEERPKAEARKEWTESSFLQHFVQGVQAAGFHFDQADLVAFHMALKASPMVVLAGRSGVGKSSLPRLYARAMGAFDDYHIISVRPDWMDDRDVVGAYDSLAERFIPAATGLVDFLRDSAELEERGDGRLRLLVLDEMNLARVEYYFASFLSALEAPLGERKIRVFSPGVAGEDDPYRDCATLRIPENVRFVGTINIDETTHFLSAKVLDRACLQTFAAPELRDAARTIDESRMEPDSPLAWTTWQGWRGDRDRVESFVEATLWELNKHLQSIRSGLGFRTHHRMLDFVAGAAGPDRPMATNHALDLALLQLVLPRVRADHPDFPEVVPALLRLLPAETYPRSNHILQELRDGEGAVDFWQLT